MAIVGIDSVGIVFGIFFPLIGTLVVYGGANAAARVFAGGQPVSPPTKTLLRYGSLFVLGMGYLICIFGIFKFPELVLWPSVIVWAALVAWLSVLRRRKERRGEDKGTSALTG